MARKGINTLWWIGLVGSLIIGTSFFTDLYRAFWGNNRIWWTPRTMSLPVEKTRDKFELYIGDKLLQKHLSDKTLFSVDMNGKKYTVVAQDIAVRLNNWENTKVSMLTNTTISGFAFGIAITIFVTGLVQAFRRDGKNREEM